MEVVPGELSGHVDDLTVLTLPPTFYTKGYRAKVRERRKGESISYLPLPPALSGHNALSVFYSSSSDQRSATGLTIPNSVFGFPAEKTRTYDAVRSL